MTKTKRGRWVSEMIGRVAVRLSSLYQSVAVTTDGTQTDYVFWDELTRGKRATYKLAGLFVQPIIHHIVAWTLGKGVTAKCDHEATSDALNEFLDREHRSIVEWMSEALRLGDSYLVVNPDGSLTQVPPNQVEVMPDELNQRDVYGYRIQNKLDKADITDEFRLDGRTVTIKPKTKEPLKTHVQLRPDQVAEDGSYRMEYENVIGRLPVVHYANNRGSNEMYGRPEAEALLELLGEYDDTLTKALQGVKIMGNPIPVIEGAEDVDATKAALATGTRHVVDEDGYEYDAPTVDFDSLDMPILPAGAKFDFKSPRAFTEDAWRMLKGLFYLMLQHSNVPEWVWGGAIASSRASVDAQMPAWELFITLRRMVVTPLIIAVLEVWLAYRVLVEPGLDADAEITLQWPGLSDENEELKLKKVEFARKEGLLSNETTLGVLDLVENAGDELVKADEDVDEAEADFEARADREISRLAAQPDPDDGESSPPVDREAA